MAAKGGSGRSSSSNDGSVCPLRDPPIACDGWCHTTVGDDKVFEYLWTIDNFKKVLEHHPHPKTVYSDQFIIPLKKKFTVWRIKIYPGGRVQEDQGHITIFLKDSGQSSPAHVRAVAEFSIIDIHGNRQNIKSVDKEYKVLNHSFGFNKFVKHSDLFSPNSTLLNNGSLTFACKISIKVGDIINQTNQHSEYLDQPIEEKVENDTFTKHMKEMLYNAKEFNSDVTLNCTDGKVPAHSAILTARSEFFKAMFTHPMKENLSRQIEMKEVPKSLCLNLLEFVYTGKVETNKMNLKLLAAADQYALLDLKDLCSKHLMRHISVENCLQTLVIADRVSAPKLKKTAKDFILENTDILHNSKWKTELKGNASLLEELLDGLVQSLPQGKRSWIEFREDEDGAQVAKRCKKVTNTS